MDTVENAPLDERHHVEEGLSSPGVEGGAAVDGLRNGGRVTATAAVCVCLVLRRRGNAFMQGIFWAPGSRGQLNSAPQVTALPPLPRPYTMPPPPNQNP